LLPIGIWLMLSSATETTMATKPLISIRLEQELAEMIKAMAHKDRRPVSQFLANLVEDAIAKRSTEHRSAA
jgi:hypothetical protein